MVYAYPYLLLTLAFGVLAVCENYYKSSSEKTTYINVLSIILFVFFFGLRGYVAYDWSAYCPAFNQLSDLPTMLSLPLNKWPWEPGFIVFAIFCKWIYPDYFFFLFACSFLNAILLFRFFRKYVDNIPFALVLFCTMGGFEISINLLRNTIAILLFLNAIDFILKKKPLPYFATCILACTFHTTALVYIPLYFVLNRKININVMFAIFVAVNIVYLFHIPILKSIILLFVDLLMPSTKLWIEAYLTMDATTGSVLSIGYIERLLTGVLLFCYMDKLRSLRRSNIFVNSMFFYLCIFLFLSEFRTMSVRCSYLFVFAYWITWIDLTKCFTYRNNKILFMSFIGIYSLLKVGFVNNTAMSDYYNILFEDKTYNERLIFFRHHFND